uniref:Sulfotransferase domain-containing protein n=1 Tax=Paramoeba aestuarina TaxID=180227 RepID=A0A7S4KMC9_9EUKA
MLLFSIMAAKPEGVHKMDEVTGYKYSWCEDTVYPPFYAKTKEKFEEFLQKFKLRTGDITICTFPKCGTTWMQNILLLLAMKDLELVTEPMRQSKWPEMHLIYSEAVDDFIEQQNAQKYRRVWKSHAPSHIYALDKLDTVEWEGAKGVKHKTIIVSRNPFDAAVSMFHHSSDIPSFEFTGDFNVFADLFLEGNVESGCYWAFHRNWWEKYQKNPETVLWVTFEDLKKDLRGQIRRLAKFLEFEETDELIDLVYSGSTFEAMKAQSEKVNAEKEKKGEEIKKNHIRKGKVGGWHGYFSEEQIEKFNKKTAEAPCPWLDFTSVPEKTE